MDFRFIPDQPANEDQLGYDDFVSTLSQSIRSAQTPYVFGVLGDWGTGKTSILNFLKQHFDQDLAAQDRPVICVPIWFDAWKYENEASVVYPLLQTIYNSYKKNITHDVKLKAFGEKFKRVLSASLQVVSQVGIKRLLKVATGDEVKLADLERALKDTAESKPAADILADALGNWSDQVQNLQNAFQELIQLYATDLVEDFGDRPIKFVILIDDLDRCLPETTIGILEGIKNHLSVEGCVFVMALNARVVYQAIRRKYPGAEIDGREYLEKILNYTFYVPEPNSEALQGWIDKRISGLIASNDKQALDPKLRHFSSTLRNCNFNNPRKIWRACNRYLFFLAKYGVNLKGKYQGREVIYHPDTIVRLIMLAEYFPTILQLLLRDPQAVKSEITTLLAGQTPAKDFEEKYGVQLSPILPQLRQNEALINLTVNQDQIPPHVQAVYELVRLL